MYFICYIANFLVILGNVLEVEFKEKSFECIFDKGLLDCILSGYQSDKLVNAYLKNIYNALSDGGIFFYVTNGLPHRRIQNLKVTRNR